jgi:uracil-DNA glycosylase
MDLLLRDDWIPLLEEEFKKPYFIQLREFLEQEYRTQTVHPGRDQILNALNLTPFKEVRVVILGQDPYHGPGQAHGLSFSVQPGVPKPPSLQNIFKELHQDVGCEIPNHGCLTTWAERGVLLLNAVLTVREGQPNSHKGKGWETFTDEVIRCLNARETPIVFILWGSHAQKKALLLDTDKHPVIRAPHPSPLSSHRGFFGSKPFSKANAFLRSSGLPEIDWQIPNL